jgi:hypothetical protein
MLTEVKVSPLQLRAEMQTALNEWVEQRPSLKLLPRDNYSVVHCSKECAPVIYINHHHDTFMRVGVNKEFIDDQLETMTSGQRFYNTVETSCSSVEELEHVLDLVKI